MKRFWIGLVFCLLPGVLLQAEDKTPLQILINEALNNNLDLKKQEQAVQTVKDALSDVWKIKDTKITLSGDYNYGGSGETTPGSTRAPLSGSLGVTVPLISQLALSGGIDDQGTASVGLSFNPFNIDTTGYKAAENYSKALNQLAALIKQTGFAIENGVLNWNSIRLNLQYLQANYLLQGDKYEARKKQYQLGVATYDELTTDEQNYLTARQKYYDGEKALLKSRQTIYTLLGSGMENRQLPEVAAAELEAMITTRDELVAGYADRAAVSDKLTGLNLELSTLEKELKVLFPLQPGLTLTANTGLPAFSFSAKATISLTANDIKFKDVEDLKTTIKLKKEEIAAENYKLNLDLQMLKQSIRIAREVWELSEKDLETAEMNLKETDFLFARGERTLLEQRQAELNKQSAEIRLYQGAISLYSAQADYLLLFPVV